MHAYVQDRQGNPTSGMFKRTVMDSLGVLVKNDDGNEADLRAGLGHLVRACAACTWWLNKPSFTVQEAATDFAAAAQEQVEALANLLGEAANKSIVHQVLHMPAAVIDHGEWQCNCTLHTHFVLYMSVYSLYSIHVARAVHDVIFLSLVLHAS